jgi:5-(carboxyamino)imidazole ribonucleotide synthase
MTSLQDKFLKANSVIGIIGGGQLGRMSCFYAHKLGYKTVIFSDQNNSPASFVTNKTIIGDYTNQNKIAEFAELIDVATFEFENIPLSAIEFLASKKLVYPHANILKITQHRILEKNFLRSIAVKTTDFIEIKDFADLENGLAKFGCGVLKTATMGYDGKGQFVLNKDDEQFNIKNLKELWLTLKNQPLILEKFCRFSQEISVIVARNLYGEIECYEPLTNIHKSGILDKSIYPANISSNCKRKSKEIAIKIAIELDLIGVLAVEFFVLADEELLVNELAPRPHNSGHFTMDASITPQFEQLIRAISGHKLGNSYFHSSGYMKNLLGQEVENLEEFRNDKNAKIHLYGKEKVAMGRKMGHVNILNIK